MDARSYLFGQTHSGFYNYLFPKDGKNTGNNYPCQKIIEAINYMAKTFELTEEERRKKWIEELNEEMKALKEVREELTSDKNNYERKCKFTKMLKYDLIQKLGVEIEEIESDIEGIKKNIEEIEQTRTKSCKKIPSECMDNGRCPCGSVLCTLIKG